MSLWGQSSCKTPHPNPWSYHNAKHTWSTSKVLEVFHNLNTLTIQHVHLDVSRHSLNYNPCSKSKLHTQFTNSNIQWYRIYITIFKGRKDHSNKVILKPSRAYSKSFSPTINVKSLLSPTLSGFLDYNTLLSLGLSQLRGIISPQQSVIPQLQHLGISITI